MRWLGSVILVLAFCTVAEAREPLAKPMARTPSIMVGGETATPSRDVERRRAARPQASRTKRSQASRVRPGTIPRASTIYESNTGAINRSIGQQQQQLQFEQRQQIDTNLFRQEIQRSPTLGCGPGSLRC
ncbi:hypothetical protein [Microvirga massiliensis]|uniref:hypothetical protein n=1 Tax=Microvirga massiliensis TaxID=1033741 RepID=UPI00062B9109|nr:hypothetical protein [Microvirga massiliensis]